MKQLKCKERIVDAFALVTFLPALIILLAYIAFLHFINGKRK